MKPLARLVSLVIPTLLLPACGAPPQTPPPGTPATSEFQGLQVAVGDCLVAPPRANNEAGNTKAFGAALIGAVISQGVNYIGKALTAAGAAKTWTISGSRNIQTTSAEFPQCVTVVRGSFAARGTTVAAWTVPSGWPGDLQQKLATKGLNLDRSPDFIFEGEFVGSADQSALAFRPVIATYASPIGSRAIRPNEERNAALFLSITAPGTKPTLETNPSAAIVLGRLAPGSTRNFGLDSTPSSPYDSPWFSLSKTDSRKPLTVHVMLSETQDESAFLTFLGAVFSDPKVTAAESAALTQILVPGAQKQADLDANSKELGLANDADAKFATAIAKLNACKSAADGPPTVSAGADARSALRAYIVADALLSPPKNDVQPGMIENIDIRAKPAAIRTACEQLAVQLVK